MQDDGMQRKNGTRRGYVEAFEFWLGGGLGGW